MDPTKKEIRSFLWSDNFNVATEKNKALVIIADSSKNFIIKQENLRHILPDKDVVGLEDTRGGIVLDQLLKSNQLTAVDKVRLADEATAKFLSRAEGNLNVIFTSNADTASFKRWHLPQILNNERITSVNHIESRVIKQIYDRDTAPQRHDSLERITLVLQGKEDISYLIGKKKPLTPEFLQKAAIEIAIQKVGGDKLKNALESSVRDLNRYNRVNYQRYTYEKKKALMTWRARMPHNAIKLFRENLKLSNEYNKAKKSYDASYKIVEELKKELSSKASIETIIDKTNEILKSKRNDIQIGGKDQKVEVSKAVEKYVELRKPAVVQPEALVFGHGKWGVSPPEKLFRKFRKL